MAPPVMELGPYEVFCGICDVVRFLTSATIDVSLIEFFYEKLTRTLAHFEHKFPPTEHAIVFHLLIEIHHSVRVLGSVYYYWMYPFERAVGFLSRKLHDRARPEKILLNIYSIGISLEKMTSMFPQRLFEGLPDNYKPTYSHFSPLEEVPLLCSSRTRLSRLELSDDNLEDLYELCVASHPNLTLHDITEAYNTNKMQFRTKGVSVRSHESGMGEHRWTTLGQRGITRVYKSSRLYSLLSGARPRQFVIKVQYFCSFSVSGCSFDVAYGHVYPTNRAVGQSGLFCFRPDTFSVRFVHWHCSRFAGVIGRAVQDEIIFPVEDTMPDV